MVSSGRVYLSEANTEDVNAPLAGQPYASSGTTNVFYASFTVKFTSLPSGGGAYFAHFKDSGSGFRARIWALTSGAAPGKFRLGISSTSGSVISATNPMDLSLNTDYTVVTRLVNSNSVATLWINPASESDASISTSESRFGLYRGQLCAPREYRRRGAEHGQSAGRHDFCRRVFRRVGTIAGHHLTGAKSNGNQRRQRLFQHQRHRHAAAQLSMAIHPDIRHGGSRTNLPGATSSNLTLTGVTFAQAGFYACVVTNAAGSTLSDPVSLSVWRASTPAFSYLTYNANGNGLTNWSTNMQHVLAIGRQVQYLNPDIITFQEIPVTNNCTAQMADFVTAFRPGYYLVTNSMDDGYIHSAILSRYPIISSTSWLHGSDLTPYGYTGSGFTRDLFEAQISVPGFSQPLHVFTVHLKSSRMLIRRPNGRRKRVRFPISSPRSISRPMASSLTC